MGHVYFIRASGMDIVKIGYSDNVPARLAALQTGSPVSLYVAAIIEDVDKSVEEKLHVIFGEDRSHGEWYFLTDALREIIADPENFDVDDYGKQVDVAELSRYLEKDDQGRWTVVFGKHRGELLEDVMASDPSYIRWILWKEDFPSSVQETIVDNLTFLA